MKEYIALAQHCKQKKTNKRNNYSWCFHSRFCVSGFIDFIVCVYCLMIVYNRLSAQSNINSYHIHHLCSLHRYVVYIAPTPTPHSFTPIENVVKRYFYMLLFCCNIGKQMVVVCFIVSYQQSITNT
jgi:hypothetical protein